MKPTYTLQRRKNYNGVPCIAPFIDGYNVWDIPEEQWTRPVAKAIQHAYEIGYGEAIRRMQAIGLPTGGEWEEVKNDRA